MWISASAGIMSIPKKAKIACYKIIQIDNVMGIWLVVCWLPRSAVDGLDSSDVRESIKIIERINNYQYICVKGEWEGFFHI